MISDSPMMFYKRLSIYAAITYCMESWDVMAGEDKGGKVQALHFTPLNEEELSLYLDELLRILPSQDLMVQES